MFSNDYIGNNLYSYGGINYPHTPEYIGNSNYAKVKYSYVYLPFFMIFYLYSFENAFSLFPIHASY